MSGVLFPIEAAALLVFWPSASLEYYRPSRPLSPFARGLSPIFCRRPKIPRGLSGAELVTYSPPPLFPPEFRYGARC